MLIIDSHSGLVDATGATRRMRALVAIGHPVARLARGLGVTPGTLNALLLGQQPHVSYEMHTAVRALFAALWARPVAGDAGAPAKVFAAARRWVGPLAWDDFDDPHEKPNVRGPKRPPGAPRPIDELAVERAKRGERVKLTREERQLVVPHLHSLRWSDELIASHLGVNERTILRDRRELKLDAFDQRDIRKARSA